MVSVCMATKNGESFIQEQINSILPQLAVSDELIISDDHSTDRTIEIIKSIQDTRIIVTTNPLQGIVSNFEHAISMSKGEYLFLADQDDVWRKDKVEKLTNALQQFDVVVSDCAIVDQHMNVICPSFFEFNRSEHGLLKNLIRNSYMGCCMAFHRRVLTTILPFPENIPMHDLWIGLASELHFSVGFLEESLVYHRRHSNNASSTNSKSEYSLTHKLKMRYQLVRNLLRVPHA